MIIPIRLSGLAVAPAHPLPPILASTGFNEVVILELQGSIDTEGDYSGESIGQLDLSIPTKPTLRIGHHLLEGKVASLSKPLAVLKTETNSDEGATSPIAFNIVAIIRKKLVFSKRPSPIVTHHLSDISKEPTKRLKAS